ncbi:glycosyltransferase [Shewanella frigidimarina]|uniref:glycosyltransferase n=1 Tax=Shewanella frigidimarina TaxID=56812 RepID=UPI003D78F875
MTKLKVLVCAPLPPPKGGIATWVDELSYANEILDLVDLHFFNTASKRKAGVYSISNKFISGVFSIFRQYLNFRDALTSVQPQVVHLSTSGGFAHFRDILFTLLSKTRKIKVVVQLHYGVNDAEYKWIPLSKYLLKIIILIADKVLVLDKSFVAKSSSKSKNVTLSFNGITPKTVINIQNKNNEIIFVGWIIEQKGIFDLVNAWNRVTQKNNWKLRIIGPALPKENLQLVGVLDESTTEYCGELSRDEVIEHIDRAKVFVLPSHTEGFPFAVLEAMERQLAIIVSDVGGMNQLFSKKEKPGWLMEPQNTDILVNILSDITQPNNSVEKFAKVARELLVNEFTSIKMLKSLHVVWMFKDTDK